jgi:DNA-binding MarR family transcriptional regulator
MKAISSSAQLLSILGENLGKMDFQGISLRLITLQKAPALRVQVKNKRLSLPLRVDLHPSRKGLGNPSQEVRTLLLASPHIPDELAKDLRKAGANHVDLNGRIFIRTDFFLLDREPHGKSFNGPVVDADLFSRKSSRIIRALLSHPKEPWEQEKLAARTKTSPALVSRILKALLREGYISKQTASESRKGLYSLKESNALLNAWQNQDDWKKRTRIQAYSILKNDPFEIAKAAQDALGKETLAFTQWFAGYIRYPFTTPPVVSAYVSRGNFPEIPFSRKVASGGNLWLIIPDDDGVFLETREEKGFRLVSDIQTFLDLLRAGQRGPEQAEAMRNWEGFNQ